MWHSICTKNTCKPYRKLDLQPFYINVNSNHPTTTIRELSKCIGKRLSKLSWNKETLEKAIPPYTDALKKSRFKENLVYTPKTITNNILERKQRKRKIIWFNPPYFVNVKANFGKIFLSLLKKHFLQKNKLHKIFNKKNVKISYSCMSNISTTIAGYNKSFLQPKTTKYEMNATVEWKILVLFRISGKPQI